MSTFNDAEELDLPQLEEESEETLGLLDKFSIPPINPIVSEIFAAATKPQLDQKILATRVESDPILTNRIKNIYGPSYFNGRVNIPSIHQALYRLGPTGFCCVALEAHLEIELLDADKRQNQWGKLIKNQHGFSKMLGHTARIISRLSGVQADLAYMGGLMHRIGSSIAILGHKEPPDSIESQIIWDRLEPVQSILCAKIAKEWHMPEELQHALGNRGQVLYNNEPHALSAILLLAEDMLLHALGKIFDGPSGWAKKPRSNKVKQKDSEIPEVLLTTRSTRDEALEALDLKLDQLASFQKELYKVLRTSNLL